MHLPRSLQRQIEHDRTAQWNALSHEHNVRMAKARKSGASAEQLERMKAEFKANRPRLLAERTSAKADAYRRTPEGQAEFQAMQAEVQQQQ